MLAEVVSPTTHVPQDADPAKRAVVRLTHVRASTDPAGGAFADPPTDEAVAVTEIAWDEEDALAFALCVSVPEQPDLVVGRAWGNIVLADHGRTTAGEDLGSVPEPVLAYAPATACGPCDRPPPVPVAFRYRPTLQSAPLTHARPGPPRVLAEASTTAAVDADLAARSFGAALRDWLEARGVRFEHGPAVVRGGDDRWSVGDRTSFVLLRRSGSALQLIARPASAAATTLAAPRSALPAVAVTGMSPAGSEPWRARADLLASGGDAADLVVELEHDGSATLRFGDGVHGRRPDPGTAFAATYRVGNGRAGNVGAGAIAHVVTKTAGSSASTTRVPHPAGRTPKPRRPSAATRPRPSWSSSGPSPRTTTRA